MGMRVLLILLLISNSILGSGYSGGGGGTFTGGTVTDLTVEALDGSRVVVSGSQKDLDSSSVTTTELGLLSGKTAIYGDGSTIKAADGSSSAPGFAFNTDTNTGWVGGNDGEWDYYANASRRFKFGGSLRVYSLLGGGENAALYQQGSQMIIDMSSSDGAFKVLTDDSARGAQLSLAPTGREWLIHSLPATNTNSVSGAVNGLAFLNDANAADVPLYLSGQSDVGLGNALANKLSQVTIQPRADANITGTTTVNASTTVTGSSTKFLSQLGIGDRISVSSSGSTYATVTAIASDTSLTVDSALGDGSSQTISRKRSILRIDDTSDAMKLVVNDQGYMGLGGQHPTSQLDVLGADNSIPVTIRINATQANITGADNFVDFRSSENVEGSIEGTGAAGVLAYTTFTGSHWTRVNAREVKVHDLLCIKDSDVEPIPHKAQLFETEICDTYKSKKVIGTYGGKNSDNMDLILGIGTGYMKVRNTGHDLESGDLLVSSKHKGLAEFQGDDIIRNYTAGKLTEKISWKNGERERVVSVIYMGG